MSDGNGTTPERVRAVIRAKLHEIAALVALSEGLDDPLCESVADGSLAVRLQVIRSLSEAKAVDRNLDHLPACERDAYLVLLGSPRPLTKARILEMLEARGAIHGESTLEHALARLVRRGWVRSSKKSPRGYTVIPPGSDPAPVVQPTLFDSS